MIFFLAYKSLIINVLHVYMPAVLWYYSAMNSTNQTTVFDRLFAPLLSALDRSTNRRRCSGYSDRDFILCGVQRVISQARSGRDWVQAVREKMNIGVTVSSFFYSLRSRRRLTLVEDVASSIVTKVNDSCGAEHDPLSEHSELNGYHVYASDGHYEKAASHTPRIEGKVYASGFFYALNLRSHSLSLLDIARPVKKKEHDMHALKRLTFTQLRFGAPKGVKVIHVYDAAVIDYRQWYDWKWKGIYIISREKTNSKAESSGPLDFDREDKRNIGVLSDELVSCFAGIMIRRVRYVDHVTGKQYSFLTNEMRVPPGLIAFMYKLRWDVEKIFDEKKNKLEESKSWATSEVARSQQAHFICMAHNLLLLLERSLEREEGITDEKVKRRRQKRMDQAKEKVKEAGKRLSPMVANCTRITQRSLQFIRWVRHTLDSNTSWTEAVQSLRPLMMNYLA